MKSVTLKNLPLPDHRPAQAFEFLTGYGLVCEVSPHTGTFSFLLEGPNHAELMRTFSEIEESARAYDWWEGGPTWNIFTEQFSQYLESLDLVEVTITRGDAKKISAELGRTVAGRINLPQGVRDRLAAALEEVKPVGESSS